MSLQKFRASERFEFSNGAIGYRPGGFADCIGPFAKVENCPVADSGGMLRTAYASGYADTFFSVPAAMSYKGKRIAGYFTCEDGACVFNVSLRHMHLVPIVEHNRALQAMRERLDWQLSMLRANFQCRRGPHASLLSKAHRMEWLRYFMGKAVSQVDEIRHLRSTIATFEACTP